MPDLTQMILELKDNTSQLLERWATQSDKWDKQVNEAKTKVDNFIANATNTFRPDKISYSYTIDLTDKTVNDAIPVLFKLHEAFSTIPLITVTRSYPRDKEKNPFGDGDWHVAGLRLTLIKYANCWSGNPKTYKIVEHKYTYRKTVQKIEFCHCPYVTAIWLRGGLSYDIYSTVPILNVLAIKETINLASYDSSCGDATLSPSSWDDDNALAEVEFNM